MRNWKQRLCSLLLCGAMLASLCPTALAEGGSISYLDQNGEVQSWLGRGGGAGGLGLRSKGLDRVHPGGGRGDGTGPGRVRRL